MFDREGSSRLLPILWPSAPWRGISRCLNREGILSYARRSLQLQGAGYGFHAINHLSIFNCPDRFGQNFQANVASSAAAVLMPTGPRGSAQSDIYPVQFRPCLIGLLCCPSTL
jgi:hypothetical protein